MSAVEPSPAETKAKVEESSPPCGITNDSNDNDEASAQQQSSEGATTSQAAAPDKSSTNIDTTSSLPDTPSSSTDPAGTEEEQKTDSTETATEEAAQEHGMSLDIAYRVLEQVRQANLKMEFGAMVPDHVCVPCLRERQRTIALEKAETATTAPVNNDTCLLYTSPSPRD